MPYCVKCGAELRPNSRFCHKCGAEIMPQVVPKEIRGEGETFGGISDLKNYVINAPGISRRTLNILAFIGIFIFGMLLAVIFALLGKRRTGWMYFIPFIVIVAVAINVQPMLTLLALIIYIAGWIHANIILSHYKSAARQRITEIDRKSRVGANDILEKGLLLHKVLGEREQPTYILAFALRTPDGDPFLLVLAGRIMSKYKRYEEAREFFRRALASTKDRALIKQIMKEMSTIR